jgi:hypothetical protein
MRVTVAVADESPKGSVLPLKIIPESLEAQADGVRFQSDCGDGNIVCGITDTALRDLLDFHRVKSTAAGASRALLPEIERLVNAKCDAGRFEEDGAVVIRPVDILRFGFQARKGRAA